jgi:hypothetical protein
LAKSLSSLPPDPIKALPKINVSAVRPAKLQAMMFINQVSS